MVPLHTQVYEVITRLSSKIFEYLGFFYRNLKPSYYMKKIQLIIAFLMAALVSTGAFAQVKTDTTSTIYGVKLDNNRNLRFTDAKKVHTEINFGGHYSGGDIEAYGIDLSASRVYTPGKNFAWNVGGQVSADYSSDYGAMVNIFGKIGVRFGNKVSFGVDALAGAGQMSFYDSSTNGKATSKYFNTMWRPAVGAQASLNFQLSKVVGLSIFGRYTHYFNNEDNRSRTEPEGWIAEPTVYHTGKWSLGATLAFTINSEKQVSGDHCWNGAIYSGYSFMGNEGVIAGVEAFHTKRTGAKWARVLGFGTEQTFGKESSHNFVFGKFGYQVLPKGSNSPFIVEFGLKAGLGEYIKTEAGQTLENNNYSFTSSIQAPAAVGKAYASVNYHSGRHSLKLGVEGGYHTCFNTTYESQSVEYGGSTSKLHGADLAVTFGYALAF